MESYIVRIYRRDEQTKEAAPTRGTIEKVGAVGQDAFGTKEELWNILSFAKRSGRRGRKQPEQQKKQSSTG